jgi:hypothetical protein
VFLLAIDFQFTKRKRKRKEKEKRKKKREKEKEKEKREKRAKRIETKAPCNNSDLVIPFKHDQVLLNFQC